MVGGVDVLPVLISRVVLAQHRVDFRKQLDGLLAETYRLGANPYRGDCVVFVKRDYTQIRALTGDSIGLYLVSRRFDGGRLRLLREFAERPTGTVVSRGELSLLFEGVSFTVHRRARPCTARSREPAAQKPSAATTVAPSRSRCNI